MTDLTGAQHGDLHQRTSADADDDGAIEARTPAESFGRLFDPSDVKFEDDELREVADHMNWVEQPLDPSVDSGIPAGYTVLGQFITHDLSFNTTPLSDTLDERRAAIPQRSATLDLDSVYNASPLLGVLPPRMDQDGNPTTKDTGRMWYRRGTPDGGPDDLPRYADLKADSEYGDARMPDGKPIPDTKAIIGDVRNDEHVMIAQLHLAFLKLHNTLADHIVNHEGGASLSAEDLHEKVRRRCEWYYQWVVVNDYLLRIVGRRTLDALMPRRDLGAQGLHLELYKKSKISPPCVPYEFSAAAFRFGHSMIRAQYRVNAAGTQYPLFGQSDADNRHLGGGRRLPAALVVDWARFFDDNGLALPALAEPAKFTRNFARKIDTRLNELLAQVPKRVLPQNADVNVRSLAFRDLKVGARLRLPTGQEAADQISSRVDGFVPRSDEELGLDRTRSAGRTPLWFYILREAECTENEHGVTGEQLGPVGGRIVAEVILGLLAHHEKSYFKLDPGFVPKIEGEPIRGMADVLRLGGAKPEATPAPRVR